MVRSMALLMCICYLMVPLQDPILKLLHEVSHGLELPTYVFSHKTSNHGASPMHRDHSHETLGNPHEHKLLLIVDGIFGALNKNKEKDTSLLTKVEFQKHITSEVVVIPRKWYMEVTTRSGFFNTTLLIVYQLEPDKPPKKSVGV